LIGYQNIHFKKEAQFLLPLDRVHNAVMPPHFSRTKADAAN